MYFTKEKISRLNSKINNIIIELIENDFLKENVNEVYIFGSCVDGCSKNPFTNNSDIDIAVEAKNSNIDAFENIKIHKIINDIVWKKHGRDYDLIWINEFLKKEPIYSNILKGERIL